MGPKGIRVAPTTVNTGMAESFLADPANIAPILNRTPLGRIAEVEDIVKSVIFLLSDQSDMVNGHHLLVEGGYLVT